MSHINRWVLMLGFGAMVAMGQDSAPRKLITSMEGKDLYVAYCASCHGLGGAGNGPVAAALKGQLADLRTISKRNKGVFPRKEVEKLILEGAGGRGAHGSEEMPVWGPVFRQVEKDADVGLLRVRRLTEFLLTLQKN